MRSSGGRPSGDTLVRSVVGYADVLDGVLARLPRDVDLAVVTDGDQTIVATDPSAVLTLNGPDTFTAVDRLEGWWAGFCTYDLGRSVERVSPSARDDLRLPDVLLGRFDTRLVLSPHTPPRVEGSGPARGHLEDLVTGVPAPPPDAPRVDGWTSSLDRTAYEEGVRRILEHIAAGDCYQVNLTRRLSAPGSPDAVSLARSVRRGNPAPHAALVRLGDVAVVSASPELFLRVDGRHVVTRPIKGTGTDPRTLAESPKDRAENVMIVDLARNDLGRVCVHGSVDVPSLCALEEHPGLYHLTSTVTGTLRPDVGFGGLLRATFPPASITGAPKPRVMQIIEDLEPVRRGVYCGSVGFFDADRGRAELNVAIRTFTLNADSVHLGVGGGIVADSDPGAEWDESELKAHRLLTIAGN